MASSASWALALSRATTTATASPTWLTVSTAIDGCPGFTMSGVTGHAQGMTPWVSAKSWPEKAATTPGRCRAGLTSIRLILAWAIGLRRMAMCSMPGNVMLSVQVVAPVIRCRSSLRLRGLADLGGGPVVDGGHALAPSLIALPAAWTAATMFW